MRASCFAVTVVIVFASITFAEDGLGPKPKGGAAAKEWSDRAWNLATETKTLVDSGNPDDLTKAIANSKILLKARLTFFRGGVGEGIIKKFQEKRKFEELVGLLEFGIGSHPEETTQLIILQKYKVGALTQLNRHKEAISAEKAYYNISSMTGKADAMQLLVTTLIAADVRNAGIAEQFRQEQIAGAQAPSGDHLKETLPRTSVLQSIKVDLDSYEKEIGTRKDVAWLTLVGKGNLQLPVDRTTEAQATFDAACLVADPK